jgi:hypothetical protein
VLHISRRDRHNIIRGGLIGGTKTLLLNGFYDDDLRIVSPFHAQGQVLSLINTRRLDSQDWRSYHSEVLRLQRRLCSLTWSIYNSAVLRLKKGDESMFLRVPERLREFIGILEGVPLMY